MNILFDNQIFSWQKFGGISRYFYELMKELESYAKYKLPLMVSNNIYISLQKHRSFFPNIDFREKMRIMNMLNRFAFVREAQKGKWDIMHSTYYDPFFLKYATRIPLVITIHDMIHEKFNLDKRTIDSKKKYITQADRIIAVSENTKKDILEIYNINPDKIDVIYHGYSIDPEIEQKIENLPNDYILFVGLRGLYKNFNRLVEAMSGVIKKHPEYHIVCTGSPFTTEERKMLSNYGIDKQTHQYFANEKELTYLYKNATAFAYPSVYEGFGIPILESFVCGCPVALSNASCFPEIAKDAGAYFDPLDVEDIERVLLQLIEDADYRRNCIKLGYQRVKNFSWRKTAQETLQTYQKVVATNRI